MNFYRLQPEQHKVQNDGHLSVVDIGDFIRKHPHPQYNKYLDPDLFRTFVIDDGNVAREQSTATGQQKTKSGPATICASPDLLSVQTYSMTEYLFYDRMAVGKIILLL